MPACGNFGIPTSHLLRTVRTLTCPHFLFSEMSTTQPPMTLQSETLGIMHAFEDMNQYNSCLVVFFHNIYRGFWTVLMLLGVLTVVVASFLIICAAPFASHILYKAGGGFFVIAGVLFSLVVVMYVIWVQAMADLENYTQMKKMDCPDFAVYVRYGWSFMLAPIGVFFSLLAGMLFLLVGRAIYLHSD
uniref:Transmembrane protein 182 n=1 Tax=Ficedula albicollis TaxID=59894 RepID=A0A803VYI6_FICAL